MSYWGVGCFEVGDCIYIHSGQHLLLRLLARSVFSRRPISFVLALSVH